MNILCHQLINYLLLIILLQNILCENDVSDQTNEKLSTNLQFIENKFDLIKENFTKIADVAKDLINSLENLSTISLVNESKILIHDFENLSILKCEHYIAPKVNNDDDKLKSFFNEIKEIKDEFNDLTLELDVSNENIKEKTIKIEKKLDNILHKLDNKTTISIDKDLFNENKNSNVIVSECVQAILNKDFPKALTKFKLIPNDEIYLLVNEFSDKVNNVYDLFYIFCNQVNDDDRKYLLYKSLTDKMMMVDDDCQIIKLRRLINDELISCGNCSNENKINAAVFINKLTSRCKEILGNRFSIDSSKIFSREFDIFKVYLEMIIKVSYETKLIVRESTYTCILQVSND
ncbi:hypothetical protein O3M35_005732 [Rhynocoris fuscipes]|uniref:Uncharacterized protein n=1 Tax=Rhynocoris fuscipes TaxID=488301 RepID=A0AAW1DKJ5_9HEMI